MPVILNDPVRGHCVSQQDIVMLSFRHRIPNNQWWLKLRGLLRILAKHTEKAYVVESIIEQVECIEELDD